MSSSNRLRRRWCLWLHLACRLPAEHVADVLGLTTSEVLSLSARPRYWVTEADAQRWRAMRAQGMSMRAVARAVALPPQRCEMCSRAALASSGFHPGRRANEIRPPFWAQPPGTFAA